MNAWTSVRVESLDKYFLMRLMLYRWNDKVLHILFIWQPMFMFSSNHDPSWVILKQLDPSPSRATGQ